jgi:hypothetical protein
VGDEPGKVKKQKQKIPSGFGYVLTPSGLRYSVAFLSSSRRILGWRTEIDHYRFLQNPLKLTERSLSFTLLEAK